MPMLMNVRADGPMPAGTLSARRPGVRVVILAGYLLVTRLGHIHAAKLGFEVGAIPLFLTDMTLAALLCASVLRTPLALPRWLFHSQAIGWPGILTSCILWLALIQFMMADPKWGLLNFRDLAIFGYVIFFPVAVLSIRTADRAERLIEWSNISGAILGVVLITDYALGGVTGLFSHSRRLTAGGAMVSGFGGGDAGGMLAFSVAGFGAYVMATGRRRWAHAAGLIVCGAALMLPQTRAAFFGLALAAAYAAFTFRRSFRDMAAILFGLTVFLVLLFAPRVDDTLPLAGAVERVRQVLLSALHWDADGNSSFRLIRWQSTLDAWRSSPLWGVGFGAPIVHEDLVVGVEAGGINSGMPHNTYLMILARTGIVGLAFFIGVHLYVIRQLDRRIRSRRRAGQPACPAEVAAANIMWTMLGFANFVLFFERPMHCAAYWIILASAWVLVVDGRVSAGADKRVAASRSPKGSAAVTAALRGGLPHTRGASQGQDPREARVW